MATTRENVDLVFGEALVNRIREFLAQQRYPALRRLQVTVTPAGIVLRGRVRTFHERQLALNCVKHVPGVRGVIDRMMVDRKKVDLTRAAPEGAAGTWAPAAIDLEEIVPNCANRRDMPGARAQPAMTVVQVA